MALPYLIYMFTVLKGLNFMLNVFNLCQPKPLRRLTNARINISNAQIFFTNAREKDSNVRLKSAEINCFYRYFKVYLCYDCILLSRPMFIGTSVVDALSVLK